MQCVGVSAVTGEGMTSLFAALERAAAEYRDVYVPLLAERKATREATLAEARKQTLEEARKHMDEDLSANLRRSVVLDAGSAPQQQSAAGPNISTNADDDDESGLPFDNFDCRCCRRRR